MDHVEIIKKLQEALAEAKRRNKREGRPRRERRRDARNELLPESRICPCCGVLKLKSKQWVVDGDRALCLSCWRLGE